MLPSDYLEFYTGLDLNTVWQHCNFAGLDGRTGLLELAAVKYYTRPTSETGLVPYGFEEIESSDNAFQVFENRNALPISYTYNQYITREEYEALSGLEKEQALLQAAVLEIVPAGFDTADIQPELIPLDYRIIETAGVEWSDQHLEAEGGGTISLSADVPEGCEVYMVLQGARTSDRQSSNILLNAGRAAEDFSVEKQAVILRPESHWYFERDAVVFNLGPGHPGKNDFVLAFDGDSSLDLENL